MRSPRLCRALSYPDIFPTALRSTPGALSRLRSWRSGRPAARSSGRVAEQSGPRQ